MKFEIINIIIVNKPILFTYNYFHKNVISISFVQREEKNFVK